VEAQEGETGRPAGGRAPAVCTAASGGDLAGTAFPGALGSGKRRGARGGDGELIPGVGGGVRRPERRHCAAAAAAGAADRGGGAMPRERKKGNGRGFLTGEMRRIFRRLGRCGGGRRRLRRRLPTAATELEEDGARCGGSGAPASS